MSLSNSPVQEMAEDSKNIEDEMNELMDSTQEDEEEEEEVEEVKEEKNSEEEEEVKENEEEGEEDGGDLGGSLGGDMEDDSLENCSAFSDSHVCRLCNERMNNPRVLPCLHSFCSDCLAKEVALPSPSSSAQERLTRALVPSIITCKICKQEAVLGSNGVEELPYDYVLMNVLDMEAIADMQIICTSCKAQEKAVARCSDCANFLCPNCVTAHQYMRCFENHKVVSFEELRSTEGITIHKPIFCNLHTTENLKYFCNTCQVPICNECMMTQHRQPEHRHERIPELGDKQLNDLKRLVSESRGKVSGCMEASSNLENMLSDLQEQRDDARGLIEETFQTYRTTLQKRKDDLLGELDQVHSHQELSIMELFHNLEKTIEKIDDGCEFTERVLKHGNAVEILLIKSQIQDQLVSLIRNTPKLDMGIKIEFKTDGQKFETAIKKLFGELCSNNGVKNARTESVDCVDHVDAARLTSPELACQEVAAALVPSFDTDTGISIPQSLLDADPSLLTPAVSVGDLIPALASLSMNSMNSNCTGLDVGEIAGVSGHTINMIASSLQQLPSMAGITAPEPTRSSSRNSYSPAMSDSGISVDAGSNSSGAQGQVITAAELAKLGNISVNSQGNIKLNNHVLPGLNINNVTGLAHAMQMQQQNAAMQGTPTPDNDLAAIFGGLPQSSSSSSRSQTPQHLNEIAGLLSQTSPSSMLSGLTSPGLPVLGSGASSSLMSSMTATGLTQIPGTPIGLGSSTPPLSATRGASKISAMQIRCKFGQLGPGKSQFNSPHGFCLGMDEDIVVADTNNHRIQVFEKSGEFKYQFGIPGKEEGQLWYPRKVAVMRHCGKYVVCDRGNERSRMQIFTKNGHFIKKIAIRYIDIVAGLAITEQGNIVAVDSVSPTVFCIGEGGDLIKWFDCSDYMREPSDIAISGKEYFVCDFKGHCVVVFNEEGQFMRRIGCENITNYPNGIDISDHGDVLVGDSHGNRFHVAVFQSDGSLIGEFECPYVKVSRCCGLNVTSEGHVVTLAKNNHHVLVLNTLYIA